MNDAPGRSLRKREQRVSVTYLLVSSKDFSFFPCFLFSPNERSEKIKLTWKENERITVGMAVEIAVHSCCKRKKATKISKENGVFPTFKERQPEEKRNDIEVQTGVSGTCLGTAVLFLPAFLAPH